MNRRSWSVFGLSLALIAAAVPTWARDNRLLLPIQAALASPAAVKAGIGSGPPLSFGSALPAGLSIVHPAVVARGQFDPRTAPGPVYAVAPPMSDEEACTNAFVLAVSDMMKQVRGTQARSLVGVVSVWQGREFDSTEKYECHAGITRAEVELKGISAEPGRKDDPAVTRGAPPKPAAVEPIAASVKVASELTNSMHRSLVPPATGFAKAEDIHAVPLSEAGKMRYRHYLTLRAPKAFVIYQTGAWRFYADDTDAMTKALDYCKLEGKTCWLYAVDNRVVWSETESKRISKSSQLGNE